MAKRSRKPAAKGRKQSGRSLVGKRTKHKRKPFAATRRFFKGLWNTLTRIWRAIRWWWGLPNWLKWGKVIAIAVFLCAPIVYGAFQEWMEYRRIYYEYYTHFYHSYSKQLTDKDARYYADYYADFYAKYYSTPAYRANLQYALPLASAETIRFSPDSKLAGMHINENGLKLIKEFEGLSLEPYADVGGKLTIGYGHLIRPGEYYTRISEAEAHALLKKDVQVAEAYVKRYVDVPLNGNQFAALVSLVYNIGPGNFQRSTMLKHLNQQEFNKASREFLRWERVGTRKIRGLARRRAAEKVLFES